MQHAVTYEVDSYHVNCGIGDCSIHILVEVTGQMTKLEKVLLLDGGTATDPAKQLARTIDMIEKNPRYWAVGPDSRNLLQFNTVVISHWDEDHYGGISTLLNEAYGKGQISVKDSKYTRFIYTTPSTMVYAQDWTENKGGLLFDPIQKTMSFKSKLGVYIPNLAKASWGTSLIGTEFFTCKSLADLGGVTYDQIKSLKDLIHHHGNPIVGMYCVSAQEFVIGQSKKTSKGWPWKLKDYPEQVMHVERTTDTNRASLGHIVAWGTSPNTMPRVSHYLGADLNARCEAYILHWLYTSGVTQITCIKASHHGARTSNPPMLLQRFTPRRIIVSAKDKHGHPAWQFLLMVHAYMLDRGSDAKAPCLFTCHPSYIRNIFKRPGHDQPDESFNVLPFAGQQEYKEMTAKDRKEAGHFEQVMRKMFSTHWTTSGLESLLARHKNSASTTEEEAFGELVVHLFLHRHKIWVDLWDGLSVSQLKASNSYVTYLFVRLTSDEATDGQAGYLTIDHTQMQNVDEIGNSQNVNGSIELDKLVINLGASLDPGVPTDPFTALIDPLPQASDAPGFNDDGSSRPPSPVDYSTDADQASDNNLQSKVAESLLKRQSKKISKDLAKFQWQIEREEKKKEREEILKKNNTERDQRAVRRGVSKIIHTKQQSFQTMHMNLAIRQVSMKLASSDPQASEVSHTQYDGPFLLVSTELLGRNERTRGTAPDLTEGYLILRDDHALDTFVSGQIGMAIKLKCPPKPTSSSATLGLVGGAELDSGDVLSMWLKLILKAEMAIYGTSSSISELRLQVGELTFSTNSATTVIGKPDASLTTTGLSKWTENETMVFGLLGTSQETGTEGLSTGTIITSFAALGAEGTNGNTAIPFVEAVAEIIDGVDGIRWNLSTAEGSRNGIWLTPGAGYDTVLRLQYTMMPGTEASLNAFLKKLLNSSDAIEVSQVTLIFKKICEMDYLPNGSYGARVTRSAVLSAAVKVNASPQPVELMVSVELVSRSGLKLKVWTTNKSAEFGSLAKRLLENNFPSCNTSFDVLSSDAGMVSKDPNDSSQFFFRRLILEFDGKTLRLKHARLAVEVNAKLGRVDQLRNNTPGQNVALLLEGSYHASAGSNWSLFGGLWFKRDYPEIPYSLWSSWEAIDTFSPVTDDAARVLLFTSLLPGGITVEPPPGIPNAVTEAEFLVTSKSLAVSGTISNCRHEVEDDNDVPLLDLREVSLSLDVGWKPKYLGLLLEFRLSLNLPEVEERTDQTCSTEIRGAFEYSSGSGWSLRGGIRDLHLGQLYGFFDPDLKDVLYDLVKGIVIKDLNFEYLKENTNTAFISNCQLKISDNFDLTLHYSYRKGGKWGFHAALESTRSINEPVTFGSILSRLVSDPDSTLVADLPSFLTDLTILSPESKLPKLEVKIDKAPPNGARFVLSVVIAGLEAKFTQLTIAGNDGEPPTTYRMFKATLSDIQMPSDVPLISKMEKPFDELGFVWLNRDMTQQELVLIDPLFVTAKEMPNPGRETSKASPFKGGFHFMIHAKQKLVLDYPIGRSKMKNSEVQGSGVSQSGSVMTAKPDAGNALTSAESTAPSQALSKAPSTKAKYSKTIGPLTISNIGCKYASDTLSIVMDATFTFGPVALDLIGFTLGLHFQGGLKGIKLAGNAGEFFSSIDVQVSISGLGVEFNKPPITISGAFLYEKQNNDEYFAGGLTIGFAPWLFKAAGFYGTIDVGKDQPLKCFFMYAMLRGPIATIGFAEISGLTAAFAYNVDLTLPTVDRVTEFPLLAPQPATVKSPRDAVRDLLPSAGERNPYFNPLDGARWLAAGMTVTAFQILEITALVVVQWSPHVQLAILGLAVADLPSPKAPVKFAHIELGIIATVDLQGGVFKLESQLSPNSYILHPSCHLTGGFALYYWFKSAQSTIEGDWVCSIGGYHSAFAVPKHYPRPERLAISWSINSNLSVRGEAYFAITPKVCMGGVKIHAALSLGALSAWFDAYADFLINFAPFSFQAVCHVSVGIRFSMSVWFVTVSISAEIGATLMLAGPPFRGTVHVDFWVFGFNIDFGDHSQPEVGALSLIKFWDMIMQAEKPPKGGQKTLESSIKDPHLFVCQQGLMTDGRQDSKPNDPWLVRGSVFEFNVTAYFAINELKLNGETVDKPAGLDAIYARPMKLTKPVHSTVEINITRRGDNSTSEGWIATPIVQPVPEGLWGFYDRAQDPARSNNNNITDLLSPDGGTLRLLMGLKLQPPEPKISNDTMRAFNVERAMLQDVSFKENEKQPSLPTLHKDTRAWLPLPEIDSELRDEGELDQWQAVREAWKSDQADPEETVDLCQKAFEWTDRPLSKKKPSRFIRNFDKLCLKAPLLSFPYLNVKV